MQQLTWHEGMSVGVASIDEDHKNLLALINEVSAAVESNHTQEVIEEVFQRLEAYVIGHFEREESLMLACNYPGLDNHIKLHRMFTDKIPELKTKLLSADSAEVAAQINLFLYDWLLNHIVGEDLQFARDAYDHGLSQDTEPKQPLPSRVALWLARSLTLGQRISLTALLPIIGLAVISAMFLIASYTRYTNVTQLLYVTSMVREIDALSHNLQLERGLSTGSLNTVAPESFQVDLRLQRTETDKAAQALTDKVKQVTPTHLSLFLNHYNLITESWAEIAQIRDGVDLHSISHNEMFMYYTNLIEELHTIPGSLLLTETDSGLALNVTAYNILLHMKESAGKQRALGVTGIMNQGFTREEHQQFSALIGEQRSLFSVLTKQLEADGQQATEWRQVFEGQEAINAHALSRTLLQNANNLAHSSVTGEQWFNTMSAWTNQLQQLTNSLIDETEARAEHQLNALNIQLYLIVLLVGAVLILTVSLSALLNQSVILPVRRITQAMCHLANGDRDMRFQEQFAQDELGRMVDAYEQCRRSLLQSDITASISSHRQEIVIDARIKEKERFRELANSDPLTGAKNRRKFIELASFEFQRAQRYQRPLSAVMLDLDLFKQINDTYGHAAGDEVLKLFHTTCQEQIRHTDILARIGGEEFAVLLPETKAAHALELAQRIRKATKTLQVSINGQSFGNLTVSVGVSNLESSNAEDIDALLAQADTALYAAKARGRDRVELYRPPDIAG
jgi:two-component system cell cycle response regulator